MPSAETEQATQKAFENASQQTLGLGIEKPLQRSEINSTEAIAEHLTQEVYDQKIAEYIAQVNQTKKILDDDQAQADAKMTKQALCQRIQAYKQIYQLSEQNIHLSQASTMKYVSQIFLDRQKTSLETSGMMESTFCK